MIGDWAQAGDNFNIQSGGPWFATIPESEWPGDDQAHSAIRNDLDRDAAIGDRRYFSFIMFFIIDIPPHSHLKEAFVSHLLILKTRAGVHWH